MNDARRLEKCMTSAALLGGAFGALVTQALHLSVAVYVLTMLAIATYQFARFMWATR